jgi:hypothetical protein
VLVAATALVALLLMHGFSAGHVLLMPGAQHVADALPAMRHAVDSTAGVMGGEAVAVSCECAHSSHPECMTRLQPGGADLPLHAAVTVGRQFETGLTQAGEDAGHGEPARPPPDLYVLCISRR